MDDERSEQLGRVEWQMRELRRSPTRWVLLSGSRVAVAAALLLSVYVVVWGVGAAGYITVQQSAYLAPLFRQFVSGNLSLIALVLSINQLVLSRELNSPGELQTRTENVTDYRSDVREELDRPAVPNAPTDFLRVLVEYIRRETQSVGGLADTTAPPAPRREIETFVDGVTREMNDVYEVIDRSDVKVFVALSATLSTSHAEHISQVNRILHEYEDSLSTDVTDALAEIRGLLYDFNVAREYFKTVYMQTELALLSRVLLYVGIPAEVASAVTFLVISTPAQGPNPEISLPVLVAAVTVAFAPLAVLFAFVLRVSTIAQETAAISPFETRRTDVTQRDVDTE